jgi:hypothetical protein
MAYHVDISCRRQRMCEGLGWSVSTRISTEVCTRSCFFAADLSRRCAKKICLFLQIACSVHSKDQPEPIYCTAKTEKEREALLFAGKQFKICASLLLIVLCVCAYYSCVLLIQLPFCPCHSLPRGQYQCSSGVVSWQ